ncbi:PhoPQ-activated protein PqaA family protein [Pseudomonas sp. WJP1]|uniref:PhoPQ-activated pathogenicity-related family protein n=1 Tax=Pseudomonas sp. WJP1 TaxID=2986947 RepID=UPI00234B3CFB|nr:PhoPQ-activated protein PqaA family protein [Pseudomonas sp. WJP1]WCM52157.1 PhoPQ-activated protein PqaA family protein [Pseudomonas sp. WJP1]
MGMNTRFILSTLMLSSLLVSSSIHASAQACFEASGQDFSEVLACYKKAEDTNPLLYTAKASTIFPGVEKRSFELSSQQWSPQGLVSPAPWKHAVDIYIPDNALHSQALLLANNGTANAGPTNANEPTDFTETMALEVAGKTRTIVISVSNVPNQYLTYADDGIARTEDASVAHSWKLFLDDPYQRPFMSVRLPMVVSMVKAMDLAQKELQPWGIDRFIASGASKRGWTVWLTAVADERVKAIVPFVIDVLGTDNVLEHTYQSYGKNWPLAFFDYHHEGITQRIKTENFARLMQIEDPLSYLQTRYAERLAIPKYIVNASSDDFFLPDNARFFFDRLPGPKALRVAPNASHYGIKRFIENSLIPVINRWQQDKPLPVISLRPDQQPQKIGLQFSETPVRVIQWTAANPHARDFRQPCGIQYEPQELSLTGPLDGGMQIDTPENGWKATFVEAIFADGFVVTTPVQVMPMRYPSQAPPVIEPACKTLADD